jgi:hypothetical protein
VSTRPPGPPVAPRSGAGRRPYRRPMTEQEIGCAEGGAAARRRPARDCRLGGRARRRPRPRPACRQARPARRRADAAAAAAVVAQGRSADQPNQVHRAARIRHMRDIASPHRVVVVNGAARRKLLIGECPGNYSSISLCYDFRRSGLSSTGNRPADTDPGHLVAAARLWRKKSPLVPELASGCLTWPWR